MDLAVSVMRAVLCWASVRGVFSPHSLDPCTRGGGPSCQLHKSGAVLSFCARRVLSPLSRGPAPEAVDPVVNLMRAVLCWASVRGGYSPHSLEALHPRREAHARPPPELGGGATPGMTHTAVQWIGGGVLPASCAVGSFPCRVSANGEE